MHTNYKSYQPLPSTHASSTRASSGVTGNIPLKSMEWCQFTSAVIWSRVFSGSTGHIYITMVVCPDQVVPKHTHPAPTCMLQIQKYVGMASPMHPPAATLKHTRNRSLKSNCRGLSQIGLVALLLSLMLENKSKCAWEHSSWDTATSA